MHKITFFPLGNADSCRIDLSGGERILFDYAAVKDVDDDADKRIDLPTELRQDLESDSKDYYDVVAFTHLDDDHIHGASEFFHLQHAQKYQGEGRIKINTLWVPAAVIIDDSCEDEAKILRAQVEAIEARTATMLHYLGEWHSHPNGYSCQPSKDDLKVFAWLTRWMQIDGYPGLMLIAGQTMEAWFIGQME